MLVTTSLQTTYILCECSMLGFQVSLYLNHPVSTLKHANYGRRRRGGKSRVSTLVCRPSVVYLLASLG